jgi:hypothetical protein
VSAPSLAEAGRYLLPREIAEPCLDALQHRGAEGDELFIALSAKIDEDGNVYFCRALVPEQHCHHTPEGLLVTIAGEAIYALNRDCFEQGELLAGQIHAHPGRAYHSGADDALAMLRLPGALSIVVPDFAAGPMQPSLWSVHRRDEKSRWRPLPRRMELTVR